MRPGFVLLRQGELCRHGNDCHQGRSCMLTDPKRQEAYRAGPQGKHQGGPEGEGDFTVVSTEQMGQGQKLQAWLL